MPPYAYNAAVIEKNFWRDLKIVLPLIKNIPQTVGQDNQFIYKDSGKDFERQMEHINQLDNMLFDISITNFYDFIENQELIDEIESFLVDCIVYSQQYRIFLKKKMQGSDVAKAPSTEDPVATDHPSPHAAMIKPLKSAISHWERIQGILKEAANGLPHKEDASIKRYLNQKALMQDKEKHEN